MSAELSTKEATVAASVYAARAALEILGETYAEDRESIIREATDMLSDGRLTGEIAIAKWAELSAIDSIHRRLAQIVRKGSNAERKMQGA